VVVVAAVLALVVGSALAAGALVDINTAEQKTLESLPGVGPATATEIVKGRTYKSVDDLANVKGIGKSKLEKIKPLVTVAGDRARPGAEGRYDRRAEGEGQVGDRPRQGHEEVVSRPAPSSG